MYNDDIDVLKKRAIRSMQEDLDDANTALEYDDTDLYKKYRKRFMAKAEMYEAMFEGELVYHTGDGKVYVELDGEDEEEDEEEE